MGHPGGTVGTGKSGETKTGHPGGYLTDLAWERPDAIESSEIVCEPGQPLVLLAKLSGFTERPTVTFKIYRADGRKPGGKVIETLTADVDDDSARGRWTPAKADPPTLPLRVLFTATAGKQKPVNGPAIDVDLGAITELSWAPASTKKKSAHAKNDSVPHFQRGDEVVLKAATKGFGKGATVKFRVYEHKVRDQDKFLEELTGTTGDDGVATSKKWKIPDSIEHQDPPAETPAPPPPSDGGMCTDDDPAPTDWEKDPPPATDPPVEAESEGEPRGVPRLPHYFFTATLAGHTFASPSLLLEPDCVQIFADPPSFLDLKPARDLTLPDARTIVVNLVKWEIFTLGHKARPRFKHAGDDAPVCELTWPRPTDHLNFKPVVAGVTWSYLKKDGPKDWKNDTSTDWKVSPNLDNLDLRNAVVIYRLTRFLKEVWGATEIYDMGIGHGDSRHHPGDCHNAGRAIDFAGAHGVCPETFPVEALRGYEYDLQVTRDWGHQPIPVEWQKAQNPADCDWKDHKGGAKDYDWPDNLKGKNFDKTTYRLEANKDSTDKDKLAAYLFFKDVFTFATKQCSDASGGRQSYDPTNGAVRGDDPNATAGQIGGTRTFICHPDHPAGYLRRSHYNHLHIQVGPTGPESSPPV